MAAFPTVAGVVVAAVSLRDVVDDGPTRPANSSSSSLLVVVVVLDDDAAAADVAVVVVVAMGGDAYKRMYSVNMVRALS